jgi:hypothetical protein
MEKMNWSFENYVPFKWKYWIMLHATWVELNLNSNSNQFNSDKLIELNSNFYIEL